MFIVKKNKLQNLEAIEILIQNIFQLEIRARIRNSRVIKLWLFMVLIPEQ